MEASPVAQEEATLAAMVTPAAVDKDFLDLWAAEALDLLAAAESPQQVTQAVEVFLALWAVQVLDSRAAAEVDTQAVAAAVTRAVGATLDLWAAKVAAATQVVVLLATPAVKDQPVLAIQAVQDQVTQAAVLLATLAVKD